MPTKKCNTCNLTLDVSKFEKSGPYYNRIKRNLTLDISDFGKTGKWYRNKCKQCRKNERKCEHDKSKDNCIDCSPHRFCKHKQQKANCIECNSKLLCEHDTRKYDCLECNSKLLCKHNIRKQNCPECNSKLLCKHNIRKQNCSLCNPRRFCKHKQQKTNCPECNPKLLCKHDIRKQNCPKCYLKISCIHCKMIRGKSRYVESLDKKVRCCAGCFYHFYPNDKIPRRYKMKQYYFNEKLIEEFGDTFEYDKQIKCGCSKRRPDWFIDCYKYSIIIELDEDQHKYTSCDEKRMMELFQDLGNRQLVLIRINPDKYNKKGKMKEGCFEFDEKNTIKCLTKEFDRRFNKLINFIDYYLDNEPEKEITVRKLFFDKI